MSQKKDAAAKDAIASALKPKAQQPTQAELEQAAVEMLAQQPLEEMEQRTCSLIIVDLNCKEIHLKVSRPLAMANLTLSCLHTDGHVRDGL